MEGSNEETERGRGTFGLLEPYEDSLDRSIQAKSKKNIETDIVGDKIGRIHLGKQDLTELQTRKMKGLKRGRDVDTEDVGDDNSIVSEGEGDVTEDVEVKRQKIT